MIASIYSLGQQNCIELSTVQNNYFGFYPNISKKAGRPVKNRSSIFHLFKTPKFQSRIQVSPNVKYMALSDLVNNS